MNTKVIKGSDRGLTFSFKHDKFNIGEHYNYVVVPKTKKIYIIPTKQGLKVSRKKTKFRNLALIDIRNKRIKTVTQKADKLGLTFNKNSITVTAFNVDKPFLTTNIPLDKQLNIKENIIKVVSLFSGCGMLDYPFHLDNKFEIVFATDIMEDACMSYRENIGDHILNKSVTDLSKNDIPEGDILIGGCPCKPFSNANRKMDNRLEKHEDSKLVLEYIRLVNEGEYKVFVMENVPELITACNGQYFEAIKECLPDYKIEAKVLKDSDFGGYSIRKRVFIVGSKIGEVKFDEPIRKTVGTVGQALSKVTEDWFNYKDITKAKESTVEKMKYIPQGGNFKDIPEHLRGKGVHSNSYKRLHMNEPSCTLTNFRKSMILHPLKDRIISVAEALAISGFDRSFKVLGSLANRQQQVGNGVPFALGDIIKNIVKKLFINYENSLCLN